MQWINELTTIMLYIIKTLRVFVLLGCIFCAASMRAATSDELLTLEAEMMKFYDGNDRGAFMRAAENLKTASREEGDDRMFYKAWGYQAIYEARNQYFQKANEVVKEMTAYARRDGSIYGEYAALHTEAMISLETQDYDAQEGAFYRALDFHHRHFPNESAFADLRELFKIAYDRGNYEKAKEIGYQIITDSSTDPQYKSRILFRLSNLAFVADDVEEFNRLYNEMERLEQIDGLDAINLYTELNRHIINGDYKESLLLVDKLPADTCAERKAIIYHRLGDDGNAYYYMMQYKRISDSLERVSYNQDMRNMYLRMNYNRLQLEEEFLAKQNTYLQYRFYIAVAIIIILILLFFTYRRYKFVRKLKWDIRMLRYGKTDAERALENLYELSRYEEKNDFSLDIPVNINKLCNYLASIIQKRCHKGVTAIFETEFPDDFKILSNPESLEKMLMFLLDISTRFTEEGIICLKCSDAEKCVRFSITDTSPGFDNLTDEGISDSTSHYSIVSFNICQSISRMLRGHIWHDEDYTHGTRFICEIPKRTITDNK